MLEMSKLPGLKSWASAVSLVTGERAMSSHVDEGRLAVVETKRWPGMVAPPSSAPARPA